MLSLRSLTREVLQQKIKLGEGEADPRTWLPVGSPWPRGFSQLIKVHIQARGDLFSVSLCCPGFVLSYQGMKERMGVVSVCVCGVGGGLFSSPPPSHSPG